MGSEMCIRDRVVGSSSCSRGGDRREVLKGRACLVVPAPLASSSFAVAIIGESFCVAFWAQAEVFDLVSIVLFAEHLAISAHALPAIIAVAPACLRTVVAVAAMAEMARQQLKVVTRHRSRYELAARHAPQLCWDWHWPQETAVVQGHEQRVKLWLQIAEERAGSVSERAAVVSDRAAQVDGAQDR